MFAHLCAFSWRTFKWRTEGAHALSSCAPTYLCRGKIWHTRNQHLRKHCGLSVAFIFSDMFQHVSTCHRYFQRIVTFPVDCYWKCLMEFHLHFPIEFHFCDFWRVIFCPDCAARIPFYPPADERIRHAGEVWQHVAKCDNMCAHTPRPPIKSLDFRGFDSSKLLILRGGNSHVSGIL